ncbi:hypothetical protein I316_03373 [Kwoniella heveanensis BCC8398]|uniref:Adhesin domain-containing protein n=1 Tax=Kwoniella heveanensis BCC8398 TaxID=1296120 RepID=A0A1B9GUY1_9TREE|nr:hypothetical protein I316_03373 [Kwoniella heveanensis BCC8398]
MTLPQYHLVPTDEKSALPAYDSPHSPIDEKDLDVRVLHPASIGLVVDRSTIFQATKSKVQGLSKLKKALIALAVVWFTLIIANKSGFKAHHHGSRHGHHGDDPVTWREATGDHHGRPHFGAFGPDGHPDPAFGGDKDCVKRPTYPVDLADDLEITPTVYGTAVTRTDEEGMIVNSANATFSVPISRGKIFDLKFDGIDGEVVVSRSDVSSESPETAEAEIIVESTSVDQPAGVVFKSTYKLSQLTITPDEQTTSHKVHLVLPAHASRLRTLSITSSKSLDFKIDDSALDVEFNHVFLRSDLGDINVPAISGGFVELETLTGSVGGTYNVSRGLAIRTLSKDIDAKVHVLPPWQGPSRPPPPHKGGDKDKRPPPPPHKGGEKDKRPPPPPEDGHKGKRPPPPPPPPGHDDEPEHDHEHDKDELDREPGHEHEHKKRKEKHHKKHKHEKKHKDKHHKKHKHHEREHEHEHEHEHHDRPSWIMSLFSSHQPHPPPPPPPPPPGPRPVFIGVSSISGNVNLTILSQDVWTSSEIKADTKVANVSIVHAESFRGNYEVSTLKGSFNVSIPETYKDHKIVDEGVSETGGFRSGIVGYKRPEGEEPPHVPDTPNKGPGDPPRHAPGFPRPGTPGGPEDLPPPPKGHSRVFAHADIGDVKVTL